MNTYYDVIVVGGGPSGGIAAYNLVKHGYKVLILEKEKLPRYKPCGGGVTSKALELIDIDISEAVERKLNVSLISTLQRKNIRYVGNNMGVMVMRSNFDYLIIKNAVMNGATLIENQTVKDVRILNKSKAIVSTQDSEFRAKVVIGADGVNSVVAKSVKLRQQKQLSVAIEAEVSVEQNIVDRHDVVIDFSAVPYGYAYIFPKKNHLSVGVYTVQPKMHRLRQYLKEYLKRTRSLDNHKIISSKGHLVPLGGTSETLHYENVVLVGDAAGLADPFWGEGIFYGIKSGQIASDSIVQALRQKNGRFNLRHYTQRIRKEIIRDLKYARLFTYLFYRSPEIMKTILIKDPISSQLMMDVIKGTYTYREYIKNIIWRLPYIMLSPLFRRS